MSDPTPTAEAEHLREVAELTLALRDLAEGYLRLLEVGPESSFAARAYKRARDLVGVNERKYWFRMPEPADEHLSPLEALAQLHACLPADPAQDDEHLRAIRVVVAYAPVLGLGGPEAVVPLAAGPVDTVEDAQ